MNEYNLKNISVGQTESFSVEVTSQMLDSFIKLTGDVNPLHSDNGYANKQSHPSRVVHGMLTASFYSTLVGVYLPGKYCLLQSIDAQFVSPVYPADELTIVGEVKSINELFKQIEIKAYIRNQHGTKVSRAKIKIGILDE